MSAARGGLADGLADGPPVLVATSHGTRSAAGRRTVALLRLAVGALRPDVPVLAAHVDVQKPALDDVVARLAAAGRRSVVVPLLLSTGYHVRSDVRRAVAASAGTATAAAALGPDPVLLDVLAERLDQAGAGPDDLVALAAAGSLAPRAVADVAGVVDALAARRGAPVLAGFASAQAPAVPDAVAALRAAHPGRRVVLASYLLAPGVFTDRLAAAGADAVCAPLGADPRIAALALRRYDEALAAAAGGADGAHGADGSRDDVALAARG